MSTILNSNNDDSRLVKDLKAAMAVDLPGWKITNKSLNRLNNQGEPPGGTTTLQVEPIKGGEPKVADYKDGKIVIVQG